MCRRFDPAPDHSADSRRLSLRALIDNTLGQSALSFPDGGHSQLSAASCALSRLARCQFAAKLNPSPSVPVAVIARTGQPVVFFRVTFHMGQQVSRFIERQLSPHESPVGCFVEL